MRSVPPALAGGLRVNERDEVSPGSSSDRMFGSSFVRFRVTSWIVLRFSSALRDYSFRNSNRGKLRLEVFTINNH